MTKTKDPMNSINPASFRASSVDVIRGMVVEEDLLWKLYWLVVVVMLMALLCRFGWHLWEVRQY